MPGMQRAGMPLDGEARRSWENAKETVARILRAEPEEVIFTSGGTEANNLGVFGLNGHGG